MNKYLDPTELLDFEHQNIQNLIHKNGWKDLQEKERILQIYNFVRDRIKFGYNLKDDIPASKVLADGYGQCNTKGILFMALLRAVKIPCRFHGFTIDKKLQKGAITGIWYKLSPQSIVHSWVEILYMHEWLNMEGFILDLDYIKSLQTQFKGCETSFYGYGVATKNLSNPEIYWNENNTYIQKEGINNDLGMYNNPDEFFNKYSQTLNWIKKWLFQNIVRHMLNINIKKLRNTPLQ
jgi:hypothetical protein